MIGQTRRADDASVSGDEHSLKGVGPPCCVSQKRSDATLGYDRLYDSETGEVYRADVGFYDSYDLHRGEFDNANLYRIDDSSSNYYLRGVDYYITK